MKWITSCHLHAVIILNGQSTLKASPEKHEYMPCKSINSLATGRFQLNIRLVIFKLSLVNGGWGISYEIALRWIPLDLTNGKSTFVQALAWCRQVTSHYLKQCWFLPPFGVTRPQWVKCTHSFGSSDKYMMHKAQVKFISSNNPHLGYINWPIYSKHSSLLFPFIHKTV